MKLAFQAVLLASDTGSRLYPLNSPATPKALLPVGNKAMLCFPLAMLEAGGVAHVLIVRTLSYIVLLLVLSSMSYLLAEVDYVACMEANTSRNSCKF